jgi:hypothetical protein
VINTGAGGAITGAFWSNNMIKTKTHRRLENGFVKDHLSIYDGAVQAGTVVKFDADFCAFDMQGELVGTFTNLKDAARSLPRAPESAS